MTKKIVLAVLLCSLIIGCTRDDICPEDTATTPLLIITFKDISNPLNAKSVSGLTIETADLNSTVVLAATEATDSIAIPLKTGANFSIFRFTTNDGGDDENTDIVGFAYEREDSYVNRACSFKTIYNNLIATRQDEGTANWIFSFVILKTTVEDELEAHLTILH